MKIYILTHLAVFHLSGCIPYHVRTLANGSQYLNASVVSIMVAAGQACLPVCAAQVECNHYHCMGDIRATKCIRPQKNNII